jgi:hypothetical protein
LSESEEKGSESEEKGSESKERSEGGLVSIQGLNKEPIDDSSAVTALKERAATGLERALAFVSDYGDDLARLRAHFTLEAASQAECVEAVAAFQRDDGSFDPIGFVFSGATMAELRGARVSRPLLGTLEALSLLADLRALSSGCAERALEFLTRMQRSDGSYGYSDAVVAREGDDEERLAAAARDRLFLTGMFAGFAARTPYVRPEVLASAAVFLSRLFSPDRVEQGGLSVIAAFAHFYANGGDQDRADEALQWCGRELERGFRTHRFEAVQTLRVLLYCDSTALPGATFDVVELLDRLLEEQAGDGGFASLDPGGPPGRVAPTIDALISIRALCQGL